MSLINQVLNDLEKRGASTNIGEATIRVVPLRRSHGTFWLLLAAVSVSVLAASAWLKWGTDNQPVAPLLEIVASPAVEPESATIELQSASQPVAMASVSAETTVVSLAAPAVSLKDKAVSSKLADLPVKPLAALKPVITAVSPNPAISKGTPQKLTITGNHFAEDATVILRTPKGREYAKRKIVKQNSGQIVISANFRNSAGQWSVEVANDSDQASGHFAFEVQAAPVVASVPAQENAALPPTQSIQTEAKPAPAETSRLVLPPAGGVSKQATQISLQQQAENEFRKAYALMQQGQSTDAISGYETALQLDAGHILARQTLVRLLLDQKRHADAERVLQQGLQHDPKQHAFALLLARIQVSRNELDQALATMQKSLPYAGKQADYQAFIAALLQRKNSHKEAIFHFEHALQLNPKSGVWLMGMGISLRAEQRTDEARNAFNRALESNSLNAELQSFVKQQLKEL
ncbi:MAG: hypothetical protein B7Y56_01930 [Gallionellales bacterium 35-53-114]|jgi:MSHA biogenesis protein MshN|nr:MAG: hypothetical protein B7Y56_01930 [Gallionellales bacterium 35-53-114]OYZ64382.1 MAG: hypothetical protein B7Y04_05710 [Gallionellales bacterium 24-53-125]OZB10309.1 MAG: hypothetical protein B7X61_01995 [Gallionellales bacterium 39-52-133]HQS56910.1 tetratricopeptide repeat protein [Gallionellaceae bacterium]HQS75306.1 tetratricopeptide repeat protein [Gallionellaceae bacterium]